MAVSKTKQRSYVGLIALIVVVVLITLLIVCIVSTQDITEVKKEDNVGKTVKVHGEVKTVLKIGSLSGYTLEDETGSIAISSESLPKEGDTITVKGVLIKDTLFGYYIKASE